MLNPSSTFIRTLRERIGVHWGVLLASAVAGSLAFAAPPARAGRFHVYSCRTPNGGVAPTDGWAGSTSPLVSTVVAKNTCSEKGSLASELKDGVEDKVATSAGWDLSVPVGETLTGAMLWRSGSADGGSVANAYYEFWMAVHEDLDRPPYVFDECVSSFSCPIEGVGDASNPMSSTNLISAPSEDLGSHIYVNASCGGQSGYACPEGRKDPNSDAAVVYLYAADLLLEQTAQPSVTPGSVGGELATDAKLTGTASVLFEASDPASGVYQAVVEVDGKAVGASVLDSNGGHCANVGQTTDGLPAFLYLKPCAPSVSADVPLDTGSLPNGEHHIVVSVLDAAGNSATVLDRTVEVANAVPARGPLQAGQTGSAGGASSGVGAPNGTPAGGDAALEARWEPKGGRVANAGAALSSAWGHTRAIAGRLRSASGTPIADAVLEVSATSASQGAHAHAVGSPRTSTDGSFSLTVPARSASERISIAYRAHSGDVLPVATQTLTLTVPASLSLSVTPRSSHAGGTIRFNGVLRGGPIPAGGKQLALQASSPGAGWRTFGVLSTNRRGRYRSSYRFRLPGPVIYRFRVLSRREADFPFASGSSNVVSVHER
jgi:hypothetical protein